MTKYDKLTPEFVKAFAQMQAELKAPKDKRNTFGNYNYRSAESILEAVKPLSVKYGIVIMTSVDAVAIEPQQQSQRHWQTIEKQGILDHYESEGARYYMVASATATDGVSTITCTAPAREELNKKGCDASQVSGGAISYAKKYALGCLLNIDDTADADATNDHGKGNQNAPFMPQSVFAVQPQQNASVSAQQTPDTLTIALAEVEACQTKAQLTAVAKKYKDILGGVEAFKQAGVAKKSQLTA